MTMVRDSKIQNFHSVFEGVEQFALQRLDAWIVVVRAWPVLPNWPSIYHGRHLAAFCTLRHFRPELIVRPLELNVPLTTNWR